MRVAVGLMDGLGLDGDRCICVIPQQVTTQVMEEVIKCEIGNINIQHNDPVQVNTDISLPLKDEKLVKLQESDTHIRQLRKQWENNNLDKNMYTMENNILK